MTKILLLIMALTYDGASLPNVQQFDSPAACADAASKVDFGNVLRGMVACVDSATGGILYLKVKQR